MKITCSKANLLKGVNIVSKAVPTRTPMNILECIFMDASSNEIKLVANDMEICIQTVVDGYIEERGNIAIDAKFLSDFVRNLPEDSDVTITSNDKNVNFSCGSIDTNITGRNGDEFTYIPSYNRVNPVVISQITLKDVIRQTIFSISENDNNKMMGGELFEIENDNLRVTSLDGHRISIRNISLKDSYESKKVIVPGKILNEVNKIVAGTTDDVDIYFSDNNIIFEFDNTVVVSRLIDGEYFKINQMLSSDYATKVNINKKALIEAINRSSIFVNEKDKKPIILDITDDNITLSISSSRVEGRYKEDISIDKEGKNIKIGFNPKFLSDALRAIDEDEVSLYMLTPKSPCFIKDDDLSYIYMILPVNFNNV